MLRRLLMASAAVCSFLLAAPPAPAQEARPAYFSQLDLDPLGNASRDLANKEPGVVLVFSGQAGSADATALFNTWANSTTRNFRGSVFGVAYKPPDQAKEILEEVLTQRNLNFPVFVTETDLLNGRQYRLMVIANGLSYDVPGLDFAALSREIARHTGEGAAEAAAATPAPTPEAPAATPTPVATPVAAAVAPSPTPAAGETGVVGPLIGTVAGAVSGSESSDSAPRSGRYYNTRYRFTVTFPPDWTYRVARNEDGAVGRAPAGLGALDLRAWAVPDTQDVSGGPGSMELEEYIEEHLRLLSEQTGTRVGVVRRFKVNDEGTMGLDYQYSFSRPTEQAGPRAPLVLHRGRIQAFKADGVFKVVSAEAPTPVYESSSQLIEDFIGTFHPFIADDNGDPIPEPPAM